MITKVHSSATSTWITFYFKFSTIDFVMIHLKGFGYKQSNIIFLMLINNLPQEFTKKFNFFVLKFFCYRHHTSLWTNATVRLVVLAKSAFPSSDEALFHLHCSQTQSNFFVVYKINYQFNDDIWVFEFTFQISSEAPILS